MANRLNEATRANLDSIGGIVESFGNCKNCRYCKGFRQTLGNGLCMSCWDNGGKVKGKHRRRNRYANNASKDEQIIDKYLQRTRGTKKIASIIAPNTVIY